MTITILILSLPFTNGRAQQYGWVDLSANIPDTAVLLADVFFIGQTGWVAGGHDTTLSAAIYKTTDGGQSILSRPRKV